MSTLLSDYRRYEISYTRTLLSALIQHAEKILDVKDDDYLLRHDIDEILDGSRPFDAHRDRFTFVLFVGYDSRLLTDPETPGYEDNLEKETLELFDNFVADLIEGSPFADLCVHVFIYPAPSLERLTQLVEDKVREVV